MKANKIKAEVVLQTGNLVDSLCELTRGLQSHGVQFTPELLDFLTEWFKSNTITDVRGRTIELSRRLSQYECVYHELPVDGCDDCAKHQVDEEWKNPAL